MKKNQRPDWDEYFLNLLPIISQRSTCDRGRASCLIVRDHRIIATGYAGSLPGEPHCDDVGHLIIKRLNSDGTVSEHCNRTQHCEMNAIAQAAKYGISIDGATIYITMEPCDTCTKMIIQCGIKRIVVINKYRSSLSNKKLLKNAKIEFKIIKD